MSFTPAILPTDCSNQDALETFAVLSLTFNPQRTELEHGAVAGQSQCQTPESVLLFQKEADLEGSLYSLYWRGWESILCCVTDFCPSTFVFQLLECAPLDQVGSPEGRAREKPLPWEPLALGWSLQQAAEAAAVHQRGGRGKPPWGRCGTAQTPSNPESHRKSQDSGATTACKEIPPRAEV